LRLLAAKSRYQLGTEPSKFFDFEYDTLRLVLALGGPSASLPEGWRLWRR